MKVAEAKFKPAHSYAYQDILSTIHGKETLDKMFCKKLREKLNSQNQAVLRTANDLNIPENSKFFLPVFSFDFFPFKKQESAIVDPRGDVPEENEIDITKIKSPNNLDSDLYFMFGVKDGRETEELTIPEVRKFLTENNRTPLSLAEVISLAMLQSQTLSRRDLFALGSEYEDENGNILYPVFRTHDIGEVKSIDLISLESFERAGKDGKRKMGIPSCMHRQSFE